jgi:translation elongation factor EF-4
MAREDSRLTDSYDHFRGVVSLVRLFSGSVKKGDKVKFLQAGKRYEVLEAGVYNPEEIPVDELYQGQVGYVIFRFVISSASRFGAEA